MDRPASWVYVVALHVAFRRRRDVAVPDHASADGTNIAEMVATRESVRAAIARLPERQRAAIVLRYFVDLPLADIALAMECAVGTVKSTLHTALQRLGVELDGDDEGTCDACG
jgi:RNA polymerase sigma factor (sigma-70 family)